MDINPKYHFLPLSDVLSTKAHIIYNYMNNYWVVHSEKGLAFWNKGYGSPQCNSNEELLKRLCPEWGEVKFIERVLVPCNITDYKE